MIRMQKKILILVTASLSACVALSKGWNMTLPWEMLALTLTHFPLDFFSPTWSYSLSSRHLASILSSCSDCSPCNGCRSLSFLDFMKINPSIQETNGLGRRKLVSETLQWAREYTASAILGKGVLEHLGKLVTCQAECTYNTWPWYTAVAILIPDETGTSPLLA